MIEWLAVLPFAVSGLTALGPLFDRDDYALGLVLAIGNLLAGIWLLAGAPGIL